MLRRNFFCGILMIGMTMASILSARGQERLDRREIVTRHAIQSDSAEMTVPLANGEFCFNVDGTGLQTLAGSTLDHRGWFSVPIPEGYTAADVPATGTFQKGRNTGPDEFPAEKETLREWMFDSPHRMNLARIQLTRADGSAVTKDSIRNVRRSLDLWTGLHRSEFMVDGVELTVETAVGDTDTVAFRIVSSGLTKGNFGVTLDFPYPTSREDVWVGDFGLDNRHATEILEETDQGVTLARRFGDQASGDYDYSVRVTLSSGRVTDGNPATVLKRIGPNAFRLTSATETLEAAVSFGNYAPTGIRSRTPEEVTRLFREFDPLAETNAEADSVYETVAVESAARWERYWFSGGAIDFSGSSDPRWMELERRVVLSQYLEKTSASGSYPPAEVGLLTIDGWRGQFHMEMVWWHLAHWFLWGRENEADKPLTCYERFKGPASELARQLGYKGYKWQKSIGPEGRTAPWTGNQVLLWKEPHPIFFAELEYRVRPTKATLDKWADVIEGTAIHMADYVTLGADGFYHLDPVMPPSELGIVRDTTYDLAYWKLGLTWANRWRERRGQPPVAEWSQIADRMAPLPIGEDGLYLRSADWPTWKMWEHPDLIGAFGNFPAVDGIDPAIAKKTVAAVIERWRWDQCWGWDFPWTAMAAVRTGQPDLAVEMLLNDSPRNRYDERGANQGGPCVYLPGNGGLLYAVAMMTAGWDGEPDEVVPSAESETRVHETAPGFPKGWRVRWENLRPAP